jgi:hypothetical protein
MPCIIIVEAEEQVGWPKFSHRLALSEGISRQAIEQHAEELGRREAQWTAQLESAQREAADLTGWG